MRSQSHPRFLTRTAFLGYIMVGVAGILFAPLLPQIIEEFQLSLTVAGLLFPAMSLGGFFGALAAGPLLDRYGTRRIVLATVTLSSVGFLITATSPVWLGVLAGFFLIGLGQRSLGTSLNTLVAKANPTQSGKYLNYLHGMYGTGALIAPLLVGVVVMYEVNWRSIFAAPVLLWIVFAVLAAMPTYPEGESTKPKGGATARDVIRHPVFIMLVLIAFGYNGAAFAMLGWIKTFLDMAGNIHPFVSTSTISIFYAALTIGRFTCGYVSRRIGYATTILICAVGTTLTYPLFIVSQALPLVLPGVFFSGLFLSGLFPTAIAIGTETFKEKAGTVTGLLTTAMTVGAILPPFWTGAIADATNFQVAMAVNMVIVLLLLAAAIGLVRFTQQGVSALEDVSPTASGASSDR